MPLLFTSLLIAGTFQINTQKLVTNKDLQRRNSNNDITRYFVRQSLDFAELVHTLLELVCKADKICIFKICHLPNEEPEVQRGYLNLLAVIQLVSSRRSYEPKAKISRILEY